MEQGKLAFAFRVEKPGHVFRRSLVYQTCVGSHDFHRHDRSLADKYRELVQRELASDARRPLKNLAIIEEVAPLPRGQRHTARQLILMNRRNQEVIAKQVMKLASGNRLHQRRATLMAGHHMRIDVRDEFRVQPGKLPHDFQLWQCALPEPALAMAAVEKKSTER